MIDKVIVTVVSKKVGFEADMELPTELPINDLASKLLEVLKGIDARFTSFNRISLVHNEVLLPENATLEEEAIWDGSRLYIN